MILKLLLAVHHTTSEAKSVLTRHRSEQNATYRRVGHPVILSPLSQALELLKHYESTDGSPSEGTDLTT